MLDYSGSLVLLVVAVLLTKQGAVSSLESCQVLFYKHSVEGSSLDFLRFSRGWGLQPIFTLAEEFPKPKIPKRSRFIAGNMFYIDRRIRVYPPSLKRDYIFKKRGREGERPPVGEQTKMQCFAPAHYGFFFLALDISQSSQVPFADTVM